MECLEKHAWCGVDSPAYADSIYAPDRTQIFCENFLVNDASVSTWVVEVVVVVGASSVLFGTRSTFLRVGPRRACPIVHTLHARILQRR
jgi:hypothetical protein